MKYLILYIIACPLLSFGQAKIPFAIGGPGDTAWTRSGLRVDGGVRFTYYLNPDSSIVAIGPNGTAYLYPKPIKVKDSVNGYVTPKRNKDTAAAVYARAVNKFYTELYANYLTANQVQGTYLPLDDSGLTYTTPYSVSNILQYYYNMQQVDDIVAGLPVPVTYGAAYGLLLAANNFSADTSSSGLRTSANSYSRAGAIASFYPMSGNPAGYITGYIESDPLSLHTSDTSLVFAPIRIATGMRVRYIDTFTMLSPYLRSNTAAATYFPIPAGTTAQYLRGDGSPTTLNTTAVPEGTNLYYTDSRARAAISVTTPLTYTSGVIGIQQAGTLQAGFLSATDWNAFSNKLSRNGDTYGGRISMGTNDNYGLGIRTNGVERVNIDSLGNVAINKVSPVTVAVNRAPFSVRIPQSDSLLAVFSSHATTGAQNGYIALEDVGITTNHSIMRMTMMANGSSGRNQIYSKSDGNVGLTFASFKMDGTALAAATIAYNWNLGTLATQTNAMLMYGTGNLHIGLTNVDNGARVQVEGSSATTGTAFSVTNSTPTMQFQVNNAATGTPIQSRLLPEYADDAAAAAGSPVIPVGGYYRTGSFVKQRIN